VPKLIVVDRSANQTAIDAREGGTVLEAIRDSDFHELLARSGGCCSYAACHVFVAENWAAATGSPGEDENDLLDSSGHRGAHSRLSCEIALDGLRFTIAPED
jgi:2Fe-2S ferredoxin